MTASPLPPDPDTPADVVFPPFAFAAATTAFVVIGSVASLYGPLLDSFARRFHLSLPTAGVVLSVHFVGALVGVPLGWLAMRRYKGGVVVSGTLITLALGATGAALIHNWSLFLASVFVIGLGFGSADFSFNTLLMRTALVGRAHRLSFANAGYGLGAVIGPVLIVLVRPHNFAYIFGAVALSALALSTLNGSISAPPLHAGAPRYREPVVRRRRRTILTTFVVAYVLYVAAETSASGWIASHLHGVGYSQSVGSLATAGFWLGLMFGRVMVGPLNRRFSDRALVMGGLTLVIVLALIALGDPTAPYAYPVMGLVIASVYPMGLIWYTVLIPHDGDGLALIILFMMIGGVIGPAAVSLMVSVTSIHAVPVVIATFALADLGVFASARRFTPLHVD